MRSTLALLPVFQGLALALQPCQRAVCNADNCARAVTGTRDGPASASAHFADCQSFFACTVTVSGGSKTVASCPTAVPSYASACSGTARFSSACSCYGASATTVTVMATPTNSAAPSSTPNPSTSSVLPVTTPGPSTAPTTNSPTTTPTTTTDCTYFGEVATYSSTGGRATGGTQTETYSQYFSGMGVTEDPNNPGNTISAPLTQTYTSQPKCSAAASCASYAAHVDYWSFDLHQKKVSGDWECVLYFNGNFDTTYFNQTSPDIGADYGFVLVFYQVDPQ